MTNYLYTMMVVITYNLISLKNSFVRYYKPYLPKMYFTYSKWKSFRNLSFDFEFESIERFGFSYFIG